MLSETFIRFLRFPLDSWEDILNSLSETEVIEMRLSSGLTLKDQVAHLSAWQQITVARMEAALHGHDPRYDGWPEGDPDDPKRLDQINAWIYETNRDKSWAEVHEAWRSQYWHLLELLDQWTGDDSMVVSYPWLKKGEILQSVMRGTFSHHLDHLREVVGLLGRDMPAIDLS